VSRKVDRDRLRERRCAELANDKRFGNHSLLGIRDIAAMAESCETMRLGPNPGSYLARNVTDNEYEGRFLPLVTSMCVGHLT
jgi:hypothetical protein